jgi:hypothetical protein
VKASLFVFGSALLLAGAPAAAQGQAAEAPVLRAGTPVLMRTAEALTSKTARQGQRFKLEVTAPVLVDGAVVIPLGAQAVGEVRRVGEKGMFGKSGELEVQLLFVEAGAARIPIEAEARDKGKSGLAGVLLGVPLVGMSAEMISGTHAVIPAGTEMQGQIRTDLPLRPVG